MKGGTERGRKSIIGIFLLLQNISVRIDIVKMQRGNNNTSQQDFGTRKIYCVSNVPFHAESKYAIKIFHHPRFLYNGLFNY